MADERAWYERTGFVLIGVFSLALTARVAHLWQVSTNPTFFAPVVDSETYDRLARAFAAGGGLSDEFFWQPPFYPLFLSLLYSLGGPSIAVARIVQLALGAATCCLTYLLGRRVFDARCGLAAAFVAAVYGPLLFFDGELLATGWAAFWSVSLVLLFLAAARSARRDVLLALGVCGALATLTRPNFLPLFVAAAVWLWLALRRGGGATPRAGGAIGLVALGFAAVAVPAVGAAQAHTGRFSLLPASGGLNLYIGNNPDSARTLAIRPGWDWLELTNLPAAHGVTEKRHTGRFFRNRVLDYVRSDPGGFLSGLAAKAVRFFSSREIPRNVDLYLFREWSGVLRLLAWKLGPFGFPFGLLFPTAAIGVALCWRRLPVPLRLILVLYPLSVVLVFVSARYRTPLVPLLIVVACGGVVELARAVAARHWRRVAAAAVVGLGCLLLTTLPGPFPPEQVNYRAEMHYAVGTRAMNADDLDAATWHLERAVALAPEHSDAHNHLALTYTRKRQLQPAVEHYRLSVETNPRSVTARANLARTLAVVGRFDEALVHFRAALEQHPGDAKLRYHYGTTLFELRRYDEAIRELRQVAERAAALGDQELAVKAEGRLRAAAREK